MEEIWKQIDAWLANNNLRINKKGASDQEIEVFEKDTGLKLPADYIASLKIHDGGSYLVNGYLYNGLDKVLSSWQTMVKAAEDGNFASNEVNYRKGKEVYQKVWWHRGWIPFAEDESSNMLCIDTAPTEKGVEGQIIGFETHEGPGYTRHKSFLEWLQNYRDNLIDGIYELNDVGSPTEF